MGSTTETNIREGATPFLQPGESVLTTLIASVRGHQQAMAGGAAGLVGGGRQAKARRTADEAGINLASPMAFVLTSERLLTFKLGARGKTQGVLNEFPLTEIGPMEVKRLGLGASVTLIVRDVAVKLESRVGAAREFAAELERARNN
jgi:hypothetical protein